MDGYEILLKEAEELNLTIQDNADLSVRIKGLYVEREDRNLILLNKSLESSKLKRCILAEEIGHHLTSRGDILDLSKTVNKKQENRARAWSYEKLISIEVLVKAYQARITTRYDLAEYIGVTELFLEDAVKYYNHKYGGFVKLDRFTVYFDPLGVMENFE